MKKELINIVFYFVILILLVLTIFINKDYSVIYNKKVITNENELNKYKDYKFVTIKLDNLEETRFSISDNNSKSIIYINTFSNKSILLDLTESTVNTGKLDLMYMKDNQNTDILKKNILEESDKKLSIEDGYYTNINYEKNILIITIKFYITVGLGAFSIILILYNIFHFMYSKEEDF